MIGSLNRSRFVLMRYSLHEIDMHDVVATTVAADRDEALEWFILDEWPEGLPYMAHTPKPTIPVFVVRAVAAHPQASQGAGFGHTSA